MVSSYVNVLFQEKLLSSEEKERLSAPGSWQERAQDFVDTLMHKSESSIQKFFDIVREHEDKHSTMVFFLNTKQMRCKRNVWLLHWFIFQLYNLTNPCPVFRTGKIL